MDELVALIDAAGDQDRRLARVPSERLADASSTAARVAALLAEGKSTSEPPANASTEPIPMTKRVAKERSIRTRITTRGLGKTREAVVDEWREDEEKA